MNKLFAVLDVLVKYTDDDHRLSTNEIIKLLEDSGESVHRNTIPTVMQRLLEEGYDIFCEKGTQNKYFLGSRTIEPQEVKLLCDALCSSQFVSEKKEKELMDKLFSSLSVYQAEQIMQTLAEHENNKADDKSMYYFYEIAEAISSGKKIQFHYTYYNEQKKKSFKHNGCYYTVSPYSTDWNDGRYYLSGYSERHKGVAIFRIDRIADLKVLDEDSCEKPSSFDEEALGRRRFNMYGNDFTEVTLKCRYEHMNSIVDKFGEDVEIERLDDEYFLMTEKIGLSPTFYGWLFQFGEDISIVSPQAAVCEYVKQAEKILEAHRKLCTSE